MDRILPRKAFAAALLILGLVLLASPRLLGFEAERGALISAGIIGALLTAIALAAYRLRTWSDEASLTLGAWAMIAPFVLGFAERYEALWTHVGAGAAAMLLGVAAADWRARHPVHVQPAH